MSTDAFAERASSRVTLGCDECQKRERMNHNISIIQRGLRSFLSACINRQDDVSKTSGRRSFHNCEDSRESKRNDTIRLMCLSWMESGV